MSTEKILDLIRDAKFEVLIQNAEEYFKYIASGREIEQALGSCCQVLYKNPTLSKDNLSLMAKVIVIFLHNGNKARFNLGYIDVLKSLHYILIYGVKMGLDSTMTLKLIGEFEVLMKSCEGFILNNSDLIKKLHTTLWNASLQKGISPNAAFLLQSKALGLLSLLPDSFTDVCSNTYQVGKLAERNNCPKEDIKSMYDEVLLRLTETLKRKPAITSNTIISLNRLLTEYGSYLYITKKCNKFSKVFRPLIALLDPLHDPQVMLSMKMNVKIVEVAINYASDQCNENTFLKTLNASNVISRTSSIANVMLLEGLRYVYQLFYDESMIKKFPSVIHSVFFVLTERIKPESVFTSDSLLKIMEAYGSHLKLFVTSLTSESPNKKYLFPLIDSCSSALAILLPKIENLKGETHVYNIGVLCCNLGVIAFQDNNYMLAGKLLDFGVSYLHANYIMCNEVQKVNVLNIIKKKATLLKDTLRYSGNYKKAMSKTFLFVALDIFQQPELLPTWIKCKRDSHKNKSQSLENICISDLYSEIRSESEEVKRLDIDIEELVLEEIKELSQLSFDTFEDEIYCAKTLMASKNYIYSLEGYLAYSKIFWSNSELITEEHSPIKFLNEALQVLENIPKEKSDLMFEYKARIYFWLYICNLQIIQEKAEQEVEENLKSEKPLTVQATDLGEEVQPNDVCSIRPATSVATLDSQDKNLLYLDQVLEIWESSIKESRKLHKPVQACTDLLSIGFIYKLVGILPSTVKAFTLLFTLAHNYELYQFWIQGVTELMDVIPELISTKVAKRIEHLINVDKDSKDKFGEYFRLSTISSLAHFYLRKGEFTLGADLIKKCLESSLMDQRTPTATEIQIMIYYVASLYAFLPKSMKPPGSEKNENALFLAMNATRKAIGLLKASFDDTNKIVCYRHKIAWLHHVTNLWLGRLCHMTAQPRLARAYLRQALTVSEKFALPIRTIELLCTLSDIDLQCDQLDDCRVKIDSIDNVFKYHCTRNNYSNSTSEDTNIFKSNKIKWKTPNLLELPCKTSVQNEVNSLIPIYVDDENMREVESGQDFELNDPSSQIAKQFIVVGQVERIEELAIASRSSLSPSSENFFVQSISSRCKKARICSVCVTPELSSVAVQTNVFLGVYYAHKNNVKGSKNSISQAEKELNRVFNEYEIALSHLCDILSIATKSWGSILNDNTEGKNNFIRFKMSQAKLSLMYHRNEILCLEKSNFEIMKIKSMESLQEINSLGSIILAFNHPYILQIILQSHSISKVLGENNEIADCNLESEACSPPCTTSSKTVSFKTPVNSSVKTGYKGMLTSSAAKRPPCTPFRIFTDNSDWPSSPEEEEEEEEKKITKGIRVIKKKEVKNLTPLTSSFKGLSVNAPVKGHSSNISVKSLGCKLDLSDYSNSSPNNSMLSSTNLSPFSQVLELPNNHSSISNLESKRGRRGKVAIIKEEICPPAPTKTKKITSKSKVNRNGELANQQLKEDKENSPAIKTKERSTAAKSKGTRSGRSAKESDSTVTTKRETRSRKNLQRL